MRKKKAGQGGGVLGILGKVTGLLGIALVLSSCATSAKFDYASAEGLMYKVEGRTPLPPVTVVPFRDARPPRQLEGEASDLLKAQLTERGTFRLGWTPLLP